MSILGLLTTDDERELESKLQQYINREIRKTEDRLRDEARRERQKIKQQLLEQMESVYPVEGRLVTLEDIVASLLNHPDILAQITYAINQIDTSEIQNEIDTDDVIEQLVANERFQGMVLESLNKSNIEEQIAEQLFDDIDSSEVEEQVSEIISNRLNISLHPDD